MPFETIYNRNYKRVTKELYYTLRSDTRIYETANHMWERLMEQYPQYEQYREKVRSLYPFTVFHIIF